MTVHVFEFTDWFMNYEKDWDFIFYHLIVDEESVKLLNWDSKHWDEEMLKAFPDRIEHNNLSRHSNHLVCSKMTDKLKEEYPEIYKRLNLWCEFKDYRK